MALFATRQVKTMEPVGGEQVPAGFEALADALRAQRDAAAAAQEIGRQAAAEGVALDDLLGDVARTYALVAGESPDFGVTRELAVSWSEASLRYFHALSCEDPLTGLATLSHVRSRLNEIYRRAEAEGAEVPTQQALVVVEFDPDASRFDRLMRLVDVAHQVRSVYSGQETIGRLTNNRIAAVVARAGGLGDDVTTLRALLDDWAGRNGSSCRVWIEGLPASSVSAEALLDELSR
ncbi:MAG: hypothetical protein ACRDPG_12825 [Nocardioidaceae bacterium]